MSQSDGGGGMEEGGAGGAGGRMKVTVSCSDTARVKEGQGTGGRVCCAEGEGADGGGGYQVDGGE